MTEYIETARGDRRYTGVNVAMLDPEKLAAIVTARETSTREFQAEWFMSTGIIYNPDETYMRTINDEGVADRGMTGEEFTDSFAVYTWSGYIEFTRAEIESCVEGTMIDLAKLVRVFGDRLERNFGINYWWAMGEIEGR